MTSLKINRLLIISTKDMHMKFDIEITKPQKPCHLQTDGWTDGQRESSIPPANFIGHGITISLSFLNKLSKASIKFWLSIISWMNGTIHTNLFFNVSSQARLDSSNQDVAIYSFGDKWTHFFRQMVVLPTYLCGQLWKHNGSGYWEMPSLLEICFINQLINILMS